MKLITNDIDYIVTADGICIDSYTLLKQATEKSIQKTAVRERPQQDQKPSQED